MRYYNKIIGCILCIALFNVYAGNTVKSNTGSQKQGTAKTTENTDKKKAKTPTASKGTITTKTNWSKIKDLFM